MKKFITAVATLAAAFACSFAAHGQKGALDPDTGLPASQPFDFPAQGPAAQFWAKRLTGYLTTSDGIRLRYSVLLPAASGRFPVVLSINGYDAGSIGGASYLQYKTSMSVELDKQLVEAGYAVMGINAAGSGCSSGRLEFTRPQLGRHGAEAVEFAASQAWSDGKVGMVNWSYGGSSQLATAQFRPPHLRAIVPGMVLTDFRDALVPGGVPAPGFVTPLRRSMRAYWERVVAQTAREEGDAQCLAQIPRNLAAEDSNSVMHLFLSHPLRDDHMRSFDLAPHAGRVQVPVLSLEAFQDQAITPRSGYYQSRLDPDKLWSVQTNGRHDMYLAAEFQAMAVRFLDRFVKGEHNGFERDTPHTTVWMETAEAGGGSALQRRVSPKARWMVQRGPIRSDDLSVKAFHLNAGQALADAPGSGAADGFDYPGHGVAINDIAGNGFWGPLPDDWKATSLAYTSPPLGEDMMVYGPGSADLWVTASAGDADLQVTVTEVRPDGQETYVQRGWLRLSNRALDTARSTPLLPVRLERPGAPMPLLPGRPVLARVEINKMGHYFRSGSRLRIWIDTPAQTGGLVFDTFTQKQRLHVLHNARYDSVVRFGVLKDVEGPASHPECGSAILQPCRPDPLAIR
ncbi:putative CocE/NonD family hydrolase [Variovorax paradoxus]|uniref:CocE/NonD family hydrolase n=1 Tax=Variovorax paradoxus TaxID=34073 RepID=UPI0027938F62|nr:CocE/NonD family hydrolase [Variovorax paradoxus]MDQ0570567.1 putative CocE/NonD family hydrolase [Variovorax paradoxus]